MFWQLALYADESERASRWLAYRRWIQITLLATVAFWWALWDLQRLSGPIETLALRLDWIDPLLAKMLLYWLPPVGVVFAVHWIGYSLSNGILGRRWKLGDRMRIVFWRTISPTVVLLFVATGFDAIYGRRLTGVVWLVIAGAIAMVGAVRLRSAEGLKLQRVKSGELYKRAFVLAREMGTALKRVYVVPSGRGHLTNAYGLGQSIAVTDNYGKFLKRAQLDFVIGHELAHVKQKHGRKKLLITVTVYASAALACFVMAPSVPYRPFVDILAVFAPVLMLNFFSRHFEYASDRASVELTDDPQAAIHALNNLYDFAQAPKRCDRLTELFLTHPALTRRVLAIGESAQLPLRTVLELISD